MELKTQGWRGVACREWPAPPPGAMVRQSQLELPLRAMSASMATQQQGSMLMSTVHITTENVRMSLVTSAATKSWPHLSPAAVDPMPCPGSTAELTLVVGAQASQPREQECGGAASRHLSAVRWRGCWSDGFPSPPSVAVGRAGPGATREGQLCWPFLCCSSPKQHSRAGPGGRGVVSRP